jgi:hypothetical protein
MTQKEQIVVLVKKINIMDEQFKYARILLDRLEDRIIALEEQVGSQYKEHKDVIFESDFDVDDPWGDKDDDDDDDTE